MTKTTSHVCTLLDHIYDFHTPSTELFVQVSLQKHDFLSLLLILHSLNVCENEFHLIHLFCSTILSALGYHTRGAHLIALIQYLLYLLLLFHSMIAFLILSHIRGMEVLSLSKDSLLPPFLLHVVFSRTLSAQTKEEELVFTLIRPPH